MTLFESPFPSWGAFCLGRVDEPDDGPLHPEELALVSPTAVDKRKREVAAGRRVAHRALREAGSAYAGPILRGPRGQPLWAEGFVGSITHAGDYAAAVVAPKALTAGVGIDLESLARGVGPELAKMICLPDEAEWVGQDSDRLLRIFSAKEAIFKACFPVAEIYLGFHDARLVERPSGGFDAVILKAFSSAHPTGYRMQITTLESSRMVLSATWLPP